jgi:predicted DNA-binding protein
MATRDRRGAQLSVELPPELLARLRAHAAAADRPVAAVVRRWIEAGLSGALEIGAAAPAAGDLAERVAELEAAVAQLRAKPRTPRSTPAPEVLPLEQLPLEASAPHPPAEPAAAPRVGDEQIPRSGDAITTAELAERTGTNRAAWNNWARDKAPGAVRKMPAGVGDWRLVGEAPAPGGGPMRKLWERA